MSTNRVGISFSSCSIVGSTQLFGQPQMGSDWADSLVEGASTTFVGDRSPKEVDLLLLQALHVDGLLPTQLDVAVPGFEYLSPETASIN